MPRIHANARTTPRIRREIQQALASVSHRVNVKYLPQMPDEAQRRYLFVAIDRATRWVYLEIHENKSAEAATRFLANAIANAPFVARTVLKEVHRPLLRYWRTPTYGTPFV